MLRRRRQPNDGPLMSNCGILGRDSSDWDAFVQSHPEGTFFHLASWRKVIAESFGHRTHFLELREGAALKGVVPLVEVRSRLFGHALISNAFCVGGGVLAADDDARTRLLSEIEHLGRELGVEYVELRNSSNAPGWIARDDLYTNFERVMEVDEQKNLLQIPRKQRAVVRKAIDGTFRVSVDKDLETFYRLYARTVRDHGTPVLAKRFFGKLLQVFAGHCDILTVWYSNEPISSVFSFYFRDRVLPYYTGSAPAARGLGSNDLMYWRLMRHAIGRNCRVFDFGRSKVNTGPYAFKKNWGFEPRPISHQFLLLRRATVPNLNPTNPKFSFVINAWRRLPLPVANLISPMISRHLA
jgi:FemAB-related protein (PEP-CTERM system-associated)